MRAPRPRFRAGRYGAILAVCTVFVLFAGHALAHPANLTAALATVQRDGEVKVTLTFDALAFALNDAPMRISDEPMNALLDGPPAELVRRMTLAREHFLRHFKLFADGRALPIAQLQFPTAADVERWKASGATPRLPVMLSCEARARLPGDTQEIAFEFPEIISNVVLTVERPGHEPMTEPVGDGAMSTRLPVHVEARVGQGALSAGTRDRADRDPVAVGATASTVSHSLPLVATKQATLGAGPELGGYERERVVASGEGQSGWSRLADWITSVARFIALGFTHILPRGFDHVLFVLGLFLLGGRLSTLLWQVTAFTVAHSITLGLALYGVLRLPGSIIEPLIAASIVLVAVDNLRGAGLQWWRVAVVFGFGLVHGMGFAGALREMGLPRGEYLRALFGFNVGVELGQLAVIAAAFLAVGWFRSRPRYRSFVVVPASLAIAGVALVWTIERVAA